MSEIDDLFTEAPKEVSAFNKEEWAKKHPKEENKSNHRIYIFIQFIFN